MIGFLVDAGTLKAVTSLTSIGPYGGRVVSFFCAATVTWLLNRTFTFNAAAPGGLLREWSHFLSVNALGGIINFLTYSTLVAFLAVFAQHLTLAVAAGSLAGLAVNFTLSKRFVFAPRARATDIAP